MFVESGSKRACMFKCASESAMMLWLAVDTGSRSVDVVEVALEVST